VVVALTGTDLYRDLPASVSARQSLELATRIVALHPKALDRLPPCWRRKTTVIYQSARPLPGGLRLAADSWRRRHFDVCVIGHLRNVKDPFRAAFAARLLPPDSRVRVLQLGAAMTPEFAAQARSEMRTNPRYRWLGEQPPGRVRQVLARSRLVVLSSKMEGGANLVSEAVVAGIPLLASRIDGTVGLLGARYPGYFPWADTRALARLLLRTERDRRFLLRLEAYCRRLAPVFGPQRERVAWARLLRLLRRESTAISL
jgi:putative glycosyltransferase (TIGR04348 family)